jgi:hypothetical protein
MASYSLLDLSVDELETTLSPRASLFPLAEAAGGEREDRGKPQKVNCREADESDAGAARGQFCYGVMEGSARMILIMGPLGVAGDSRGSP